MANVLARDSFLGSDATLLTAHTPTGADPLGTSWSRGPFSAGDYELEANSACVKTASTSVHHTLNKSGAAWPTDYSVAFDFHFFTNASNSGVTLRHDSITDACYMANYEGANWVISKFSTANPGVGSSLATVAYTYPGTGVIDHMIFEAQGTSLRLWKNGVLFASVTDATISAAGPPGVRDSTSTPPTATTAFHVESMIVSDFLNTPTIISQPPLAPSQRAA